MKARTYLPVALNLERRAAIIVGWNESAYFKAAYLADFGVRTTVLAPPDERVDPRLEAYQREGRITLVRAAYRLACFDGHHLAVICTGDRTRDHAIARDARARHLLVNVVDDPDQCDFFASAYVRHGAASIAVTTGGVSPGFAGALKDRIAELFGPALDDYLARYEAWRALIRTHVPTFAARERLWRELRADGLYRVLERDGPEAARALVDAKLAAFAPAPAEAPGDSAHGPAETGGRASG
ncbi:MAG: bifunctional precorrin-2 dehydrogenase/sirohydrochlorin ferrochelatase [Actinobacteria bacterium]|nr:bifunctional precorrin-2 dehydrogenase/sirohydrochlorin ferrochelatase [Actinomycetota bacterium]